MTGLEGARATGESTVDAVRVGIAERAADLLRRSVKGVEHPVSVCSVSRLA